MFEPCPTCGGSGFYFQHIRPTDGPSEPCPDCEGRGRVVSESVIEEMADYLVAHESQVTVSVHSADRLSRALARVVLEHMEDNE